MPEFLLPTSSAHTIAGADLMRVTFHSEEGPYICIDNPLQDGSREFGVSYDGRHLPTAEDGRYPFSERVTRAATVLPLIHILEAEHYDTNDTTILRLPGSS